MKKRNEFNLDVAAEIMQRTLEKINKKSDIGVLDFAETYVYLEKELGPFAGKFSVKKSPYLKDIFDCLDEKSSIELVVVQKGAQMGLTLVMTIWLAYIINTCPSNILLLLPSRETFGKVLKKKLKPLFRGIRVLDGNVNFSRTGDRNATFNEVPFRGGSITLGSARSPNDLATITCQYVVCDETDRYLDLAEGKAMEIGMHRCDAYGKRAKRLVGSTPTDEGTSNVNSVYKQTDMCEFFCPCNACGHHFVWDFFRDLKWEGLDTPMLACPECGEMMSEQDAKGVSMLKGEYRSTRPEGKMFDEYGKEIKQFKNARGFKVSSMYSLMVDWDRLVQEYIAAKDNPAKLKVFINTYLAEVYGGHIVQPKLWENFDPATMSFDIDKGIPDEILFLTMTADVQKGYVIAHTIGWDKDKTPYFIDRFRIRNKSSNDKDPSYWRDVFFALQSKEYKTTRGRVLRPRAGGIDSGWGMLTEDVYRCCTEGNLSDPKYVSFNLVPVKGEHSFMRQNDVTLSKVKWQEFPNTDEKSEIVLYRIAVSRMKMFLYYMLENKKYRFTNKWATTGNPVSEKHFKELTAERLETDHKKNAMGINNQKWTKDPNQPNELLDCAGYALALIMYLELDWEEMEDNRLKWEPVA